MQQGYIDGLPKPSRADKLLLVLLVPVDYPIRGLWQVEGVLLAAAWDEDRHHAGLQSFDGDVIFDICGDGGRPPSSSCFKQGSTW